MNRKYTTYDERYSQFLHSIERLLLIGILIGFVSLVVCQAFLSNEGFRSWMVETVRLEGVASS